MSSEFWLPALRGMRPARVSRFVLVTPDRGSIIRELPNSLKKYWKRLREAAKKVLFLVARPLRGWGGRVNAGPLRKKNFFWI